MGFERGNGKERSQACKVQQKKDKTAQKEDVPPQGNPFKLPHSDISSDLISAAVCVEVN